MVWLAHGVVLLALLGGAAFFIPGTGQQAYAQATISLDRDTYPVPFGMPDNFGTQSGSSPDGISIFPVHASGISGSIDAGEYISTGDLIIHVRINDPNLDVMPTDEDSIAQNIAGQPYGPIEVSVTRGSDKVILATAGGVESRGSQITVGTTNQDPADTQYEAGPVFEVSPDSGIFELDLRVRYTDGPASSECPDTEMFTSPSTGVLAADEAVRFSSSSSSGEHYCILQGDILTVQYTDPTYAAGASNTVSASATFDLRNGVLESDKEVYIIGSDMILTLREPDFDLENDEREAYDLDLIEWSSNAAELTMGNLGGETAAFDAEPTAFRETGDSTGIFQVVIEIPDTLEGNRLNRGEEIRLEYTDWGPSSAAHVGDEVEYAGALISTSNFGATIELDQKTYTWTDKVYITITAPDFGWDSDLIDVIGDSVHNPINITTIKGEVLENYRLEETGVDTNVFTGQVTLTGFDYNADGDINTGQSETGYDVTARAASGTGPTDGLLPADNNDGIEVRFVYSENATATYSAPIKWNTGEVEWLESSYLANGSGTVRVTDPDMNWNPEAVDTFEIDVVSNSDTGGIEIVVTETDRATGIFEGTVMFHSSDVPNGNKLLVVDGDTVTAEYKDNTLPEPNGLSDEMSIRGTTFIGVMAAAPVVDSSGEVISFDRSSYTWTDRVYINVTSPDDNRDPNEVEDIGTSDDARIIISTGPDQDDKLDRYILRETGADTGIFSGAITLRGFSYNVDGDTSTGADRAGGDDHIGIGGASGFGPDGGMLPAEGSDQIRVEFHTGTGVISSNQTIGWSEGTVKWTEASYPPNGTGVVRVTDRDMNWDPDVMDEFTLNVTSGAMPGGIALTVGETGDATGIFEGMVEFVTGNDTRDGTLLVAVNGTVNATYRDGTLSEGLAGKRLDIFDTVDIRVAATPEAEQAQPANTVVLPEGISLTLDKSTYTWTDRIFINITAPEYNKGGRTQDVIGDKDSMVQIRIQVGNETSLDHYTLKEKDLNTGVFIGGVILTGFAHDADGNPDTGTSLGRDLGGERSAFDFGGPNGTLPARPGDAITVSFNATEGYLNATATVGWNEGTLKWLKSEYSESGTGTIQVTDPDMNWSPSAADEFSISVESNQGDISVEVTETGDSTGVFEGTVKFGTAGLEAYSGSTVTATYTDHTIPGADTDANKKITSKAKIKQGTSSATKSDSTRDAKDDNTPSRAQEDKDRPETPSTKTAPDKKQDAPQLESDSDSEKTAEDKVRVNEDTPIREATPGDPTCGEGTELVGGVCQAIGINDRSNVDVVRWLFSWFR